MVQFEILPHQAALLAEAVTRLAVERGIVKPDRYLLHEEMEDVVKWVGGLAREQARGPETPKVVHEQQMG